ncbi:MAG: leucine-rich repeat protein [Muribaculaceae bacterium]|nr:leucine-rich repeat protein [Muribaculaceae bacterium]
MKRYIILTLFFGISVVLNAATTFTINGIEYTSSTAGVASVKSGSSCSGDVVIPDTVVYNDAAYEVRTISASAFKSNKSITSITIPKTITSMGSSAFSGCTGLLSVEWNAVKCSNFTSTASSQPFNGLTNIASFKFGDDVTTIPAYLCYGLTGLNCSLVIPDAVTTISAYAFNGCSGLNSVTIGNAVTSIGQSAFSGCTGLTSVRWNAVNCGNFTSTASSRPFNGLTNITSFEFGDEVTTIPAYLCYGLTGLNCPLIIPATVTAIGNYAFYNCSGLNGTLVIPDAVTSIGTYVFYNCSGLNGALVVPDAVTSIGSNAFYGCSSLDSVTIDKAVTSIGQNAFAKCTGLMSVKWNAVNCGNFTSTASSQPFNGLINITSFEFGDEVTRIPAYLCYGLTGLNGSLVIPDAVTAVGADAFYNCSGLKSVIIGKAVTTIGQNAFAKCTGLMSVQWNARNCADFTSTASSRPFNGLTNITSIEFGNEVTTIPAYLCYGLAGLNCTLFIPNSVTSIGTYAFYNCSGLNGPLVIPAAVTSIGTYVFYNCSGLNGVLVIPDAVTSIGSNAFYGCSGLNSVTIGNAVSSIGQSAFSGCTGLTSVRWNATNCTGFTSTASSRPFNGLTNITSIVFGNEVKTIPAYLCYGLTSLNCTMVIPDLVTTIGQNAFAGCSGLSSVKWNAVNCSNFTATASSQPFNGLTNITSIDFGNEVTTIPAYLCYGLTGLNCPLVIPSSVTSIGDYAFYNCSGLNSATIGNAVTEIGTSSFYGCAGLSNTLVIPPSVTTIGQGAFYGCSGITKVILEDGSDLLENGYASYSYSGGDPYAGYGYEGSSSCTYTFNSCNVDSIYIGRKVKNYLFGSNSSSWGNGSSSDYYGKNTKVKTVIYSCNQQYLEKLCTGIETLTFMESVTSLTSSSIASTALRDVYVYWSDPPTIAESFFTTSAYNNAILHIPEGASDTYKSRVGWKNFTIVENAPSFILGDVDGDGVLNIADICKLIDMLISGDVTVDMRIYDVNNNNKLDIADIITLIDLLL